MTHTVSGIISDETLSRIVDIESAGNPNAKAGTSSATGLGQFLKGTWLDTIKKHRPDLFNGPPYDDELALRTDPQIAIEMLARFTEDNATALGRGYSDADLYLAHFSGVGTARKLLRADPAASAATVFSAAAIAANRSILDGKTCGEVRAWAARKMARARTHWVATYCSVPTPRPRPQDETPPPPDVPVAPERDHHDEGALPRQSDDPGPEPHAPPSFLKRAWKKLTGWIGGGAAGGGLLAFLTDPWVVAILVGAAILIAIALILWIGPGRVRAWIIRQFGGTP